MLGQNIRMLRQARGLSQVDLGKRLNVSKQSISNWENDNIMPSVETLVQIADFFSVSTDYLLGRTDKQYLDVSGLTQTQITHLQMLAEDLRR